MSRRGEFIETQIVDDDDDDIRLLLPSGHIVRAIGLGLTGDKERRYEQHRDSSSEHDRYPVVT